MTGRIRAAVLVDAAFYLHHYRRHYAADTDNPKRAAEQLWRHCLRHLEPRRQHRGADGAISDACRLYRIFVYDCPPLTKKAHNPISGKAVDFAKTPQAQFRFAFHDELKKRRGVALRLGYLDERNAGWKLRDPQAERRLLSGKLDPAGIQPHDVQLDARQKGVDMRIGLDIASLAFKKQVERVILIAGDSDFVPAAKLARREGLDFILDPLFKPIRPDLQEHVDAVRTPLRRPGSVSSQVDQE